MRKILSASEMSEVDSLTTVECEIPSILLMENAAHAVVRALCARLGGEVAGRKITIFCGKGNNGGDGAAVARLLWLKGAHVSVYLFGKTTAAKGDARVNFEMAEKLSGKRSGRGGVLELTDVTDIDSWLAGYRPREVEVLIDAVFGTGLSRPVEGNLARVIELTKKPERLGDPLRISIDLPSGLDADKAAPIGPHAEADMTVSFTAPKLANVMPPASEFNGELVVSGIGTPDTLVNGARSMDFVSGSTDARDWLEATRYSASSYKNKRGSVMILAGSADYPGAAVLAANGAMRSGAGIVMVASPESALNTVAERVIPEVITRSLPETASGTFSEMAFEEAEELASQADVVAVGCGIGSSEEATRGFVKKVIEGRSSPLVIDADGLNAIAPMSVAGNDVLPLVLTPHEGEFRRLLGEKDASAARGRIGCARDFAVEHGVFLVSKGERVLIAAPDGRAVVNPTGNSGLGKAGNGDNLTGIIAGFLAQGRIFGIGVFSTLVAAVYLSGLAGDIARERFGRRVMVASDVREALAEAISRVADDDPERGAGSRVRRK